MTSPTTKRFGLATAPTRVVSILSKRLTDLVSRSLWTWLSTTVLLNTGGLRKVGHQRTVQSVIVSSGESQRAVSYTHLDVYKRQFLALTIKPLLFYFVFFSFSVVLF